VTRGFGVRVGRPNGCRRRHLDPLVETSDTTGEQFAGRQCGAQLDRRFAETFTQQHVGIPAVDECAGDVEARACPGAQHRLDAIRGILGGLSGPLDVFVDVLVVGVDVGEVVQRELPETGIEVIREHLIGEHARRQHVLPVGKLKLADDSVDDEPFEGGVRELRFLQRSRVGDL
jgi:hypothetical protein